MRSSNGRLGVTQPLRATTFALGALLGFAVAAAARADSSEAIPAVPLTPTTSPDGSFRLAMPSGWSMRASPQDDVLSMTPEGKTQPTVFMAILDLSDLRFQTNLRSCAHRSNPFGNTLTQCTMPSVQMQLQDSSRPWTPEESVRVIEQRIARSNRQGTSFGQVELSPISSTRAFYRVPSTGPVGALDNWGSVTMYYMPNPMLGRGEVTSLALFAGCSAPVAEVAGFQHICAGVLHSLRASPNWANRFATGLVDGYVQEANTLIRMARSVEQAAAVRQEMITHAGQAIQQMQYDAFQTRVKAQYHEAMTENAALAGDTLMKDPETGKVYSVPYGYSTYCIDDNSLSPTILGGNYLPPGSIVGKHRCARVLSDWN